MDIFLLPVRLDQIGVAGTMRQYPKLDLRVIRIHKHIPVLRYEHLPYQPSKLHTHRNILKVRLCTAKPSGRRDGLVEFAADPSVCANIVGKTVRVGRF